MVHDVDVAVAGAGPAGATLARHLSLAGLRVALIEKQRLPRYKSCAGGIPIRTERLLDFPIDAVVEDTVDALDITYLGRYRFRRDAGRPIARMVMRDRFDALLVQRACDAGAVLMEDTALRQVTRAGDRFRLETDHGCLTASFVAGADGANSRVGRSLGLGGGMFENVALEAEVRAPPPVLDRWRGLINLDLGYRPWGYAWIFPKADLLSIGLVLPAGGGPRLREDLDGYLDRLGLRDARIERVVGHKIPARRGEEPIAAEGVLLAGDAAGLTDEFTEEGISYAVHSGRIAARHILRADERGDRRLGAYQRAVDRAIMPELRAARRIARLFYWSLHRSPWLIFQCSRRVPYLWSALFRVLRGESTYDRELSRWPFLSGFARLLPASP
ncbi:MAG: geranylgeranyl reductase family protein [Dehalococcoidia bacterium]